MGYAKYKEDNREITEERTYLREKSAESGPQYGTNTVPSVVPFGRRTEKEGKYYERYIVCESCDNVFRYPVYFQKLVKRNDWEDPKRCSECRTHKKT